MHDNDHDHPHEASHIDDAELPVRALESVLTAKGYVDPGALDRIVELHETRIGPRNGAAVVAKAWYDPRFRDWLLKNGSAAIRSLGFTGRQGEYVRVLENTPDVHNLVVCTLCSCYPWPILGLPPAWYKSREYRARAVSEPRAVLSEFGIRLPESTRVCV